MAIPNNLPHSSNNKKNLQSSSANEKQKENVSSKPSSSGTQPEKKTEKPEEHKGLFGRKVEQRKFWDPGTRIGE